MPSGPTLIDTKFRLPEFWRRNIIYFANLKSLFFGNAEQTRELASQVGEIDSYGGRLAPVLNLIYRGQDNTLVLERRPDPALLDFFKNSLGLSLPRIETMSHRDYQAVDTTHPIVADRRATGDLHVDGYVTDETLEMWARALSSQTVSTFSASRQGNDKSKLYEFLATQRLATPDTRLAESAADARSALKELRGKGYRSAAVRSAIGASGIGMMKADLGHGDPPEVPSMLFQDGPCLVQGWFEPGVNGVRHVSSPSVQLFLDDASVHMFDITDQILSEASIHEGNQSPPLDLRKSQKDELIRQAGEAGSWLHAQGYRGTASADFLVVAKDGMDMPETYVCELNARVTGATYPSVLARHLAPDGAWLMRNLRLEQAIEGSRLLGLIDQSGYLFKRSARAGIVPLNFNFTTNGQVPKGQFLCLAPTVDECRDLLQNLVQSLPFKTTAERD